MTKLLRRARRLKPLPAPPPGYVLFYDGQCLVPMRYVEQMSKFGVVYGPPPEWRDDPSYFWAKQTKRKR